MRLEITLEHPLARIKNDEGGSNDSKEGYWEILEWAEKVAKEDEEESAGSPCQKLPDHCRGDRDIRAAANEALETLYRNGVLVMAAKKCSRCSWCSAGEAKCRWLEQRSAESDEMIGWRVLVMTQCGKRARRTV